MDPVDPLRALLNYGNVHQVEAAISDPNSRPALLSILGDAANSRYHYDIDTSNASMRASLQWNNHQTRVK
jgi:hypothetical protein